MHRTLSPSLLFLAGGGASAMACEDKPPPAASAPSATATVESAPTPPPKPTLPPTLVVDASGALVAGTRVSLDGSGAPERLKTELAPHREFIEGKEVRCAAERQVKPAYVATMLDALGALGAVKALVRTSTRSEFPSEVGFVSLEHARSSPPCSVVAMITEDRGSAVWSLRSGVAGKRGKGMAGPDLTLTGETLTARAKQCADSHTLFVAGAPGVEWGLVYDLAASTKTLPKAYFNDIAVLAVPPVPGRAVELGR
jgi:hypothetical protein